MRKIPIKIENPFDNYIIELSNISLPVVYDYGFQPNTITTLSNIAAIIVVILLFKSQYYLAAFFVIVSYFFDCLDGHMARTYNMVTIFGDYYDHISDTLKFFSILTAMYIVNSKKFFEILPFIITLLVLSFIHMGCQELYYNKDQSQTLSFLKKSCPVSDKPSKNDLINVMKNTRLFGTGTLFLGLTIAVIYYNF